MMKNSTKMAQDFDHLLSEIKKNENAQSYIDARLSSAVKYHESTSEPS